MSLSMGNRENNSTVTSDPLWYKDAVIYQLHVKAFFDSNDNGIGDFRGLTQKLDYVQDLGVNTLWLLPFYPSPLRDDGYDISDYHSVHADYGAMREFREFVRAAHRRGLRVITELVINHTSDQHPWFQAARRAPRGSRKRDFYVWSDSDQKYADTRIIFTDTETSNWAWDPVAQQYYWHRFFSHQPDLNFDNEQVLKAVFRVMRFWLDAGVDGMRLDAVPYLCEREGTNNENLPDTHVVLKRLRAELDARYQDRLFLAEANQWPEDVLPYLGNGDECHMAFHFPLMPRIYMAVAQEDRHPIVEILDQTPEIPANCQWAIFLRNHDELTLEMVTDRERDYMYQIYAGDPRMRINVGIRRRLAPLMDNDMDKIQLMNSLLLSMPGSPIIYYGDELGMGDNFFLGDRNGMRTPMQWSPDRNAGFSRADPQRLYLPPVMDPIYGYQAVNVESQSRDPSSLLNWMKRVIAVRKNHQAFGRGTLKFLKPGNRKVLAYVREFEGEAILCVSNLSRAAQPVELDLSTYKGRVPMELLGRTAFPPIGELPYLLTLPGYAFYWFQLRSDVDVPRWHEERLAPVTLSMLVLFAGWRTLFPNEVARIDPSQQRMSERLRAQIEYEIWPKFIAGERWFGAKGETIDRVELMEHAEWTEANGSWLLGLVRVHMAHVQASDYFLPLALVWEDNHDEKLQSLMHRALARVRRGARTGVLLDALAEHWSTPSARIGSCPPPTVGCSFDRRHVMRNSSDRSRIA
jgi:maltose alpha-D-glucosyltransferase / alpha-amylase